MNWTAVVIAVVSFVVNGLLALAVYSLRSTIRIAVLEAMQTIQRDYATKTDVADAEARLKEQIGLRSELLRGFSDRDRMLRARGAVVGEV